MHVWNVLHTARWKYRTQKSPKIAIWAPCATFSGYPSQPRHVSTIEKKNLLNSNISSICPHNMANFCRLTAEICSGVWGTPHPNKVQRVSHLGFVIAATSLKEANKTLQDMFGRLLGWYTIYTFLGGSCPLTKFCRLQNSLRPSFAFSCFGSITARHLVVGVS